MRSLAQAFPQLPEPVRGAGSPHPLRRYLAFLAVAICWRVCALGVATAAAQSGYAPPLAAVAAILVVGAVTALWRRRSLSGQIWRWAVLSSAVAWLGPAWSSQYGHLVALVLLLAVLSAVRVTRRAR